MDIASATQLVDNLVFFPGWEFKASDHSKRFEGTISVRVEYPSCETSRERAAEGYPETNKPYVNVPIVVRDLDDIGLYRALIAVAMEIAEHEFREALRVKPTLWAPFHPHQIDGMRRWQEGSAQMDASTHLRGDLQFGLA